MVFINGAFPPVRGATGELLEELAGWLAAHGWTVEIVTGSDARWVADTYPTDEMEELADGRLRIVLPVTTVPWLERLLLRLDPSTEVTDTATGESLRGIAATAAERLLRRYGR